MSLKTKNLQIRTITEPGTTTMNKTGSWRVYKPEFDSELCSKCGICEQYCPDGIVFKSETGYYPDYDYCKGCGICATVCPKNAIKMIPPLQELNKRKIQVEKLENGLLTDKIKFAIVQLESPFYNQISVDENRRTFYWKENSLKILRQKIISILNQILKTSQNRKIDVIVFPEYTIPDSMIGDLKRFANENSTIIVAGSSIDDAQGIHYRKNICHVLVPYKKEYLVEKKEISCIELDFVEPGEKEGLNLSWEYNNNTYYMQIILSLDYINLQMDETRRSVIVVPMCSENIDFFFRKAKRDIKKGINKCIILCNTVTLTQQKRAPLIRGGTSIYAQLGISKENEVMTIEPYLFSWEEITRNDMYRFIEYLSENFGVNLDRNTEINEIDNGRTINASYENNSISLRLNDEKTKAFLTTNDGRTEDFIVKMENGKHNIYEKFTLNRIGWGEGVLLAELNENLSISDITKLKLKSNNRNYTEDIQLIEENEIRGIVNPLLFEKLGKKLCFTFIITEDYWKTRTLLETSEFASYTIFAISGSIDLLIQHFADPDLNKLLKENSNIIKEKPYFTVNKVLRWFERNTLEPPNGKPTKMELEDILKLGLDWRANVPIEKRKEYTEKKYILGRWKNKDARAENKIHAFILLDIPNVQKDKTLFDGILKSLINDYPYIVSAYEGVGHNIPMNYLIEMFDDSYWVFSLVDDIHQKCSQNEIKCRTMTSIVKKNISTGFGHNFP